MAKEITPENTSSSATPLSCRSLVQKNTWEQTIIFCFANSRQTDLLFSKLYSFLDFFWSTDRFDASLCVRKQRITKEQFQKNKNTQVIFQFTCSDCALVFPPQHNEESFRHAICVLLSSSHRNKRCAFGAHLDVGLAER